MMALSYLFLFFVIKRYGETGQYKLPVFIPVVNSESD